jgi:hypothetical protein
MSEENDRPDEKSGPWWTDVVKEVTTMGLGTLFMTEEAVRNYLKDKKLPKEIVTALLENVGKKKEDLYDSVAKEFGRVLSKVDISKEVARFLETHKVSIEARLTFEPKEEKKE